VSHKLVIPVPDEFGVDDFISVGCLMLKVYNAYADAPEQFCSFSEEFCLSMLMSNSNCVLHGDRMGAKRVVRDSRVPGVIPQV